ncbi:MAG: T9SS type A sorting domain-containing protein [Bacteroidetes bacterium]|nr:T9SS type A sorting domain-containing protein [Bacteroidota bacterium]
MKKIKKMLLTLIISGAAQWGFAQYTLQQVIVLNEGPWGGPVTVGSYNPATQVYQNFDTLQARFASDVIIDSGFIYVAADTLLVKYDLNTKQKLNVQTVKGIRELAIWKNQILVTRAESSPLPSYFQAYNKNNLSFIYDLPSVSERCAEVKVWKDTAYVAVNGWGTVGKLAIINLNGQNENREIDLGPDGLNPEAVFVSNVNGKIYTQNNLNWTDGSVTKYDGATSVFVNTRLNRSSGCSGSEYYLNNVYFQASNENKIGVFSASALYVWDSLLVNKSLYGIGIDSVNARIYISTTDYTTYGKVFTYDFFGALVDSFAVNVSPGTFAFDVRTTTGISENNFSSHLLLYPNPVSDELHIGFIDTENEKATVTLTDVLGRIVFQKQIATNIPNILSMTSIPQGAYLLKVETSSGITTKQVVKQ